MSQGLDGRSHPCQLLPVLTHMLVSFPSYRLGSLRALELMQKIRKMLKKRALRVNEYLTPDF